MIPFNINGTVVDIDSTITDEPQGFYTNKMQYLSIDIYFLRSCGERR